MAIEVGSSVINYSGTSPKYGSMENFKVIPIIPEAGCHNGIVRCKDITFYYTDGSLWDRINGTNGYELFEDLFLGDYFTTGSATINFHSTSTSTTDTDTRVRWWQIGGFDWRNGVGSSTELSMHNLTIIPCAEGGQQTSVLYSGRMYNSTPFTAGYVGSLPGTDMLSDGLVSTSMQNIFGSHLVKTSEMLATANNSNGYNRYGTNSGCSSNWDWKDCYGVLLSEVECYGSIAWSSSGYDGCMDNRGQLPLFRLKPSLISTRSYDLWLRSVAYRYGFAYVDRYGYAYSYSASNSCGIRPRFVIS
jgi:hypothetical protein